ncbi:hypothetical protein Ciccas_012498 [Cichlidogyrus casuarinus]|uniref:C2H2-type domain-containing protein n=1 Tax=Cichlidogyrus casuarinus TaxID=1844966 RepID=A0ABD2PNX6_9PLAT
MKRVYRSSSRSKIQEKIVRFDFSCEARDESKVSEAMVLVNCAVCRKVQDNFSIIFHYKRHVIMNDVLRRGTMKDSCLSCLRSHKPDHVVKTLQLDFYCHTGQESEYTFSCPICLEAGFNFINLMHHFKEQHLYTDSVICPYCLIEIKLPIVCQVSYSPHPTANRMVK